MSRTLLRPAALLSHVLVLLVVVGCVVAGQWQLQRLDELRTTNERSEERLVATPVELGELAEEAATGGIDDAALEYRRVTTRGTYLADEELLLEGRSYNGQTGRDSFVPLELDDGTLVLVRRGWVPRELGEPPLDDAAPPPGAVELEGYLQRSVPQPTGIAPRNPETGELGVIQIPDVDRIADQLDGPVFPMILRLTAQDPPPEASPAIAERGLEALPVIPPVEPFDERNHLSYALQWHSFALLALIAYGAWWRTRLRGDDGSREGLAPDAQPDRTTTPV
jgi:surfeit locus 1 family protein